MFNTLHCSHKSRSLGLLFVAYSVVIGNIVNLQDKTINRLVGFFFFVNLPARIANVVNPFSKIKIYPPTVRCDVINLSAGIFGDNLRNCIHES